MKKKISVFLASLLMLGSVSYAKEDINLLKTNKEYMNSAYKVDMGKNKPKINLEHELLRQGMLILADSDEYLWFAGGNDEDGYGNVLYKSKDLGNSFEKVYAFEKFIEAVHITPKNVIFVSVSNGRWKKDANCEVFRSLDGGINFEKVLDVKSGAAINWNFASDDDGYVFISEYGYKTLPDNARRIYRSKDNGGNFEVVYQPNERDLSHNHIIQIDKDNKNIIYQSIGDRYKEVIRSTDRGNTWHRMVYDYNPTAMLQIGDNIFMGLDNHPTSGIIKVDKNTKNVSYAFKPNLPIRGSVYDLFYANGIMYAGFLSYSQPSHTWPGSMFISRDEGKTWENIIYWPKINSESGIGFYNFFEKDGYGFVNCQLPYYVHGMSGHYVGTMKFKLLEK